MGGKKKQFSCWSHYIFFPDAKFLSLPKEYSNLYAKIENRKTRAIKSCKLI